MMFTVGCKKEVSVKIQDANLENVIREMIDKPKGKIYVNDVEEIRVLDATGKNIKDLLGIENLVNLRRLNLEKNDISNIEPLRQLNNLEELCLDNNDIRDINALENIISIENLSLSSNRIEDISHLKNLKSLKKLKLDSNDIMDIGPLAEINKLEYINLSGNKINNIVILNKLENLNSLYLENNSITSFSGIKGIYDKIKNKDFVLEDEKKVPASKPVIVQKEYIQPQYIQPQYQVPTYVTQLDYIFPLSNMNLISYAEIENLDHNLRAYARNEIFARYGYIFKTAEFKNYFESKYWYSPNPYYNGDTNKLNSIEIENIERIKKYE